MDGEKKNIQKSFRRPTFSLIFVLSFTKQKQAMSEVKYSKNSFEGYTHRFIVTVKVDDDWRNDTRIYIYSNSGSREKLEEYINKNKSERVVSFEIEHCASKDQDYEDSKIIDDWAKEHEKIVEPQKEIIVRKKHIDIERLRRLENSIGFLSSYKTVDGEVHHIGPNNETEDVELTKLFKELGEINIRRSQIIRTIMGEE